MNAVVTKMNRFPCGHFDSASYCRECRAELLRCESVDLVPAAEVAPMVVPTTLDEAIDYRDACLRRYQGIERDLSVASSGKRGALIHEKDRALNEYQQAKKLLHKLSSQPIMRRPPTLVLAPVLPYEGEDAVPMRNADFLRYVGRQVRAGKDGPFPRPKVKP